MVMDFIEGISPRKYQEEIFKTCSKKNCLVVLPTGLGKTLIALMLTIERMKKYPGSKALILAPTKPLVEQHLETFRKFLPELFGEITIFTGKINAQDRKKLWDKGDIIFSTPQCIANDSRKNLYSLENVSLLVEDEAHRCVKNYAYNTIIQKYLSQAENPRILGLTASPGNDSKKIKKICQNLNIEEVELRSRESPDVKEYLQELNFKKEDVDFPSELFELKMVMEKLQGTYIKELEKRKVLFGRKNKIDLIELQQKLSKMISRATGEEKFNYMRAASVCAQVLKLHHAIELLETQTLESLNLYLKNLFDQAANNKSKGVKQLVSKTEFNYIHNRVQELLDKGFEHPKLEKLKRIVEKETKKNSSNKKISRIIVFTQFRSTASSIAKKLNEIAEIKSKIFVGQTKKQGVGLKQKDQKKIISQFSEGEINTLISTSIGEEGLDIPEVDAVIFYEPIPSAIRKIQRAGRTARLKEGKLFILVTKKTRDETFYYVSLSREKKMYLDIEKIKKELAKENLIKTSEKSNFPDKKISNEFDSKNLRKDKQTTLR